MKYFINLEYIISISCSIFSMKLFDLNKNGSIEFLEFLGAIACCRYKKNPRKIKPLFSALDTNNDVLISVEDIKRFYKIFSSDDQPDDSCLNLVIMKLDTRYSDTNGDGNINRSEFSANFQIFERHSSSIRI